MYSPGGRRPWRFYRKLGGRAADTDLFNAWLKTDLHWRTWWGKRGDYGTLRGAAERYSRCETLLRYTHGRESAYRWDCYRSEKCLRATGRMWRRRKSIVLELTEYCPGIDSGMCFETFSCRIESF
ncbi:unnamed protein product [Arctia plantaginis]|uniref:Uncharacterized protein n=1 Tax=Arctia plantaginis TaxID=874455 RepID=A0A8S0YPV4_ARCPL|nr:unnamed protein product [Arctia plantaginis]